MFKILLKKNMKFHRKVSKNLKFKVTQVILSEFNNVFLRGQF